MTGVAGRLRVANQTAAELGKWSMVPGAVPGTKEITAECVSVNRWLMAQSPEVIELKLGSRPLRWRLERLEMIGDGAIRGVVAGAPEVR